MWHAQDPNQADKLVYPVFLSENLSFIDGKCIILSIIFDTKMPVDSLLYQIALTLLPGIGNINGKRLALSCGSAEQVFHEKKQILLKIPGIGE